MDDRGEAPDSIEGATHESFEDRYTYDVEFNSISGSEGAYGVTVTVHWKNQGKEFSKSFYSVLRPK